MKFIRNIGGGILLSLVIGILLTAIVCGISGPSIRDKDAFPLEMYYVGEGDCAWDIYKETCPQANWSLWGEYVAEINNDINIAHLKVGDKILIPIPKDN